MPQSLSAALQCYLSLLQNYSSSQAGLLAFPFARPPIPRLFPFTQVNTPLLIRARSPYLLPEAGTHAGEDIFRNEGK